MGNGRVSKEVVNQMLGLLDDNQPIEILYALQAGNESLDESGTTSG